MIALALLVAAFAVLLVRAQSPTTSTSAGTSTSAVKTSTTTTPRLPQSYALDPCNATFNLALRAAQTTAAQCAALNDLGSCIESQILGQGLRYDHIADEPQRPGRRRRWDS